MNKVILIGRLGKEPEVRYTQGGKAVANFSIATDESYKNSEGEKVKKTEWHNLVIWGPSVEAFIQPYVHMGDLVAVEGKLQTRSWDDKEGNKKYTTEINVSDLRLLVSNQPQDAQSTQAKPAAAQTRAAAPATRTAAASKSGYRGGAAAAPAQQAAPEITDEDIPF